MATRCPRGAYFDEGGICGCGAGHENQDALDLAPGADSCTVPICGFCNKPLEEGDHRACFNKARARTLTN
ncbi:hypothetical protein HYW17_01340 [Candidatus Uhrbacteria bacterium]|nr:hypothetical protein [Candidatus Uhrbacteria bacterium]